MRHRGTVNSGGTRVLRFGVFELDLGARELRKHGVRVRLQDQPFRVLQALLEKPGEVVTRDELKERLWADDEFVEFDKSLSTAVLKIRQALGDSADNPRFVQTVPRHGYRFLAPVERVGVREASSPPEEAAAAAVPKLARRLIWSSMGLAAVILLWWAMQPGPPEPLAPLVRFELPVPAVGEVNNSIELSADGRYLAYRLTVQNTDEIQIWDLSSRTLLTPTGTEGVSDLCFSPDSEELAFRQGEWVKRIDIESGLIRPICRLPAGSTTFGITWGAEGTLLLALRRPDTTAGMHRVDIDGGEPEPLEMGGPTPDSPFLGLWPSFLDKSERFLFLHVGKEQRRFHARIAELGSQAVEPLPFTADSRIVYAAEHVLFANGGALVAQPVSPGTMQPAGTAQVVANNVRYFRGTGSFAAAASHNGVLVYREATSFKLLWVDRTGRRLAESPSEWDVGQPRLSRDDSKMATAMSSESGHTNLWLLDAAMTRRTQLTDGPGVHAVPVWSPDEKSIVYSSDQHRTPNLFQVELATKRVERLLPRDEINFAQDWSPDGRYILFTEDGDLWLLDTEGGDPPRPYVSSRHRVGHACFSPDGRWVAHYSEEPGRREVFVRSFDPTGATEGAVKQISINGGRRPRWRRDGRELFYVRADNRLVARSVRGSASIEFGDEIELFETEGLYDVTADGERFVVRLESGQKESFQVVVNWPTLLERSPQ